VIRPGPAAILGLGLCLGPAVAIALWPGTGLWLAVGLAAWLAMTLIAAARLPSAQHLLVRASVRGTARLGQPVTLRVELTNLHFQRLSIDLAHIHSAPIEAGQGRLRRRLEPGEQTSWELELVPHQRGALDVGSLRASLRGRLAWIERLVELPLDTTLQVHPASLSPRLIAALYPDALPDRPRPTTERVLFAGLRAFVAGDDARDLSWSASVRTGAPMVRTWEGPREGPVVLLLDRGAGMGVELGEDGSRLDRGVAVATGLLRTLTQAGRPVTVAAWSQGLDLWRPRAGRGGAQALAELLPGEAVWDPGELGATLRRRLPPAATVVIITEPDGEPEALARSLTALTPHAAVRVLLVGEPGLAQAAVEPVRSLEQAYRCAAALALQAERRATIARWRRCGASVVDAGGRRRGPRTERASASP